MYVCIKNENFMEIAIFTIFNGNNNYGGMLQAYALQHIINTLGYNCKQVIFESTNNVIYTSKIRRCKQYSIQEIIKKVFENIVERKTFLITDKIKTRLVLFDNFRKNVVCCSKKIYSLANIDDLCNDFDIFVVGSDQVWNPNVVNKFFFLDFKTTTQTKIAYAASIGRSHLSKYETSFFRKYLNTFDFISVREKSAKLLLEQCNIIVPVSVTLDPTMLLTKEEWNTISVRRIIQDKYVLFYAFSYCSFHAQINEYYTRKGLKVVFIPYVKQKYNAFDNKLKFEPIWDVGPSEFLSLIKYAEYVITDSFHGTVFSIIYNRQFFVFKRDLDKNKTSKNARLNDLLSVFSLKNRLIMDVQDIQSSKQINYSLINATLETQKAKSIKWLSDALNKSI